MQINKSGMLFYVLAILAILSSCTSTIYIAPKQADCFGVPDQKCYLIRKNIGENWILHDVEISGFEYEPGFSYKLKIKRERIKNPPPGASTFKIIVVEVYEKTDVTDDLSIADLVNKEWKLEFLKQDGIEIGIEDKIPTIKFDTDGKVMGTGGCNNFFGTFTIDGRTIKIGDIGSTKKYCEGDMDLESTYFEGLGVEMRALFDDGKLVLTGDGGNQMIFGYK